jgi:hypothetical protein
VKGNTTFVLVVQLIIQLQCELNIQLGGYLVNTDGLWHNYQLFLACHANSWDSTHSSHVVYVVTNSCSGIICMGRLFAEFISVPQLQFSYTLTISYTMKLI